MPDETSSVASIANAAEELPQATQALPTAQEHAAVEATQAAHEPLPAALDYTLTVGQAQQRFAELKRHVPKDRTIQNYCQQGDIAAQKIRTTFGSEWIINAQSLEVFILHEPEMPSVASDARVPDTAAHASQTPEMPKEIPTAGPPQGGASDAFVEPGLRPTGEKRNLVDVLIENARLLAQVEDRNEMISELKQERTFMQDQVRSAVHLSERALAQGDTLLKTIQVMRIGPGSPANQQEAPRN
jgi:hypothetical protein